MDDTTSTATSDTSTSSTSSAPTTTASPTAPAAPATRPSFKQALVQAETSTAPTSTTATDATVPVVAAASPASEEKTGFIATANHIRAVENARKKERDALQAQYAWTQGLNPDEVKNALGWRQAAQSDPTRFLSEFIAEGLANPQIRPTILSLLGQSLNQAKPQGPKPGDLPKPRFQTTDDQGNAVPVYTAEDIQTLTQSLREQLRQEMQEKVAPFEQQRQLAETKERLTTWRTSTLSEMEALDGYKDHEAEIKAVYAAMPPTKGGLEAEAHALFRAYTQVVIPHLKQSGQDATLAKLKRDAAATTLNPSSSGLVASNTKQFRGKDGLKKALEHFSALR